MQVVAQRYYKNHTTAEFRACNCNLEEGPCKEGCPCASRGLFCEKFCACGPRCTARWTGCECRSGCGTKRCPCVAAGGCWAAEPLLMQSRSTSGAPASPSVGAGLLGPYDPFASISFPDTVICCAAGRECDPDLCAPCRHTTNAPETKPDGAMDCLNMPLRLRQHKRVAMGISQVAGWGAFAMVSRLGALQLL